MCTLPTNSEGQPSDTNTQQNSAQIEEAAFDALKHRTPTAKAEAKTPSKKKRGAKAKANIMKTPSASSYSKSKSLVEYQCPLPEGKWVSYHTARQLAVKAGLDDDSAKAYGRDARAKAALAWDKKFG